MTTFETWDNDDDAPIVEITANNEVIAPLCNTYQSWAVNTEDGTAPPGTYTRGLPWFKRTALAVRGWIHVYSPDYFASNHEMLVNMQIERFRTDPTLGTILGAPNELATNALQSDTRVYWRHQRWLAHSSSWTSPEDFNTLKYSVFVNARFRMPLDEMEVPGIRWTNRSFLAGGRVRIRPMLRTLLMTG